MPIQFLSWLWRDLYQYLISIEIDRKSVDSFVYLIHNHDFYFF